MSYYIDFRSFVLNKFKVEEVCIITKHMFKPYYICGRNLCDECIFQGFNMDFIFYCHKKQFNSIKKRFPQLRLIQYNGNPIIAPDNILCIWRDHEGECAYRTCLSVFCDFIAFE